MLEVEHIHKTLGMPQHTHIEISHFIFDMST